MKIKYILPIAFAIAASSAHAYYESKTTFKLTYTYVGEYTDKTKEGNPEYSYEYPKVVEKIGNKELLEALLEDGEVDMGGTIKGWSFLFITDGDDDEDVFIVKKDMPPINVSDFIYIAPYDSGEWDSTYKGVSGGEFESYTGEYFSCGAVYLDFNNLDFESDPTGSTILKYEYDEEISDDYFFLGCEITGLAGTVDADDEGENYGFIGGSVSASAGVETDVYDEM